MHRFPEPAWPNYRTVLVTSPDLQDSSSWWRAWGPFCHLRDATPKLNLTAVDFLRTKEVDWLTIESSHVYFVNRPFDRKHIDAMRISKSYGRPGWVDFDDLMWNVPRWNRAASFYDDQRCGVGKDCATTAAVVTTSTPYLAEYVQERIAPDADITVIPNALPDWYPWPSFEREKLIVYRGGITHLGDIISVSEELLGVLRKFPDWRIAFCGSLDPWFLTGYLPHAQFDLYPQRALGDFHSWLFTSGASILIAPLADHPFNRAKSNISWMEGTFAGAAVLAPDFEEFQRPGCTNYKPGEFGARLSELIVDADRAALVKQSQDWIDAHGRLSKVNEIRHALVTGLIGE